MAVASTGIAGNLRVISDFTDETVGSYQQIRHNMTAPQVQNFVDAVIMLRGETDGNAYLTLTTAIATASA